jgi:hypothetical protein
MLTRERRVKFGDLGFLEERNRMMKIWVRFGCTMMKMLRFSEICFSLWV